MSFESSFSGSYRYARGVPSGSSFIFTGSLLRIYGPLWRVVIRASRAGFACGAGLALLGGSSSAIAAAGDGKPPPRVVVLHSFDRLLPGSIKMDEGFRTEMEKLRGVSVEVFTEFLDTARLPSPERESAMESSLRLRFADRPPQVLVAMAEPAFRFLVQRRASLFPGTPLIAVGISAKVLEQANGDSHITGIPLTCRVGPTSDVMLKMQPGLREVVFVAGSSEFDQSWDATVEEERGRLSGQVKVTYWARMPLAEVLQKARLLPRNTAVFCLTHLRDPSGQTTTAVYSAEQIAKASSVPVFGMYETYVGAGVVGGYVSSFTENGALAARVVDRVLAGGTPAQIGAVAAPEPRFVFDARQLDRWDISQRALPKGSQLLFARKGVWQQHPRVMPALAAAVLTQTALILALLINRQRQRRTDAALRVSEERYREVVESQTEMVCRYRPDCTLTFVNDAYCRFFGKRREELLGKSFLELIPAETHPAVQANVRRVIEEKRLLSNEHVVLRFDSSVGWMQWDDFPIFDERGELEELQGIGRDITERHQAQDALRQSEEKFASAFQASPSAIMIKRDKDGVVVDVNEAWEELFRIKREDAIGRTLLDLKIFASADDRQRFRRFLEDRNGFRNQELQMSRSSGEARWVSVSWELISLAGEACSLSIIQDITERKEAEEARQNLAHATRLALVGELTASIAHEINQPLGAILSNAEAGEMLLERPDVPLDDLRAILGDIRKDDLRASEVIQRVRALAGKRPVEIRALDLNAVISDVLRLVTPDARRREVSLGAELAETLPEIRGDRVQLEQVLLNLILNGMDAMNGASTTQRRLIVRSVNQAGRAVQVSIADTGHGIPPDKLPHIFDSFFTTKEHGMGLGLALVRSIVELHRGQIVAENNADGGATFRLSLPVNGHAIS